MLALGRGDPHGTGMEDGGSDRPGRGCTGTDVMAMTMLPAAPLRFTRGARAAAASARAAYQRMWAGFTLKPAA